MSEIKAEGLGFTTEGAEILRDIDCLLRPGGLIGLVGPNGAGKSTLARLLAGLRPASRGRVLLDGADVLSLPAKVRARTIAYMPQGHGVHWPIEVAEIVALGRLPHRRAFAGLSAGDRKAIQAAMAKAEVDALAGRVATTLSGGEKARVMLARALAAETPILLVDEPIASLDPYHQLKVMALLREIAEEGRLVLVVLHDLPLAARFCQRLLLLDRGRLVARGRPEAVLTAPQLAATYGIEGRHGAHEGERYVLPWRRLPHFMDAV